MTLISDAEWADFANTITQFSEDTAQQDLLWQRTLVPAIPKLGNDEDTKFEAEVTLKCLLVYNVKRVWPLTKYTDSGEEDKQSVVAMLLIQYLEDNNYLDANGNFAYDAGKDKFIIQGITYYSAGDTSVSQLKSSPLYYNLILRRSDYAT